MRRITGLAALAGICLFGIPAVASADTLAVQVGGEVQGKPWIDLQGIYPKKPVVHVGDSIDFSIVGFHTIAVQPNGSTVLPIVAPTGGTFAPQSDANGDPFWWALPPGVPAFGLNAAVFTPTGTTFDGTALVHSGGPAPLSVTFTAPGTYQLACEVHPFMRGTVRVVGTGVHVRHFAKQEKKGMRQLRKDAKRAQKLDKRLTKRANKHHGHGRSHGHKNKVMDHVSVRTGAGTTRFSLLRFYPMDATVKVGGTVTWKWTGFNEVHTVTIAPQNVLDDLDATLFGPPGAPANPVGALPTEPPGSPNVHSATVHGNGLLGAGIVRDPGFAPPNTFTAQFTTPGVFTYECLIHDGMTGTITVKA
jgi:plastocyanin